MSQRERKAMIRRDQPELSLSCQCEFLAISRSLFYYIPKGESPDNLALMRWIDGMFLKYPFYGSRQMVRQLRQTDPPRPACHVPDLRLLLRAFDAIRRSLPSFEHSRERTDKLVREVVLADDTPFVPLAVDKRGKTTEYGAKSSRSASCATSTTARLPRTQPTAPPSSKTSGAGSSVATRRWTRRAARRARPVGALGLEARRVIRPREMEDGVRPVPICPNTAVGPELKTRRTDRGIVKHLAPIEQDRGSIRDAGLERRQAIGTRDADCTPAHLSSTPWISSSL